MLQLFVHASIRYTASTNANLGKHPYIINSSSDPKLLEFALFIMS